MLRVNTKTILFTLSVIVVFLIGRFSNQPLEVGYEGERLVRIDTVLVNDTVLVTLEPVVEIVEVPTIIKDTIIIEDSGNELALIQYADTTHNTNGRLWYSALVTGSLHSIELGLIPTPQEIPIQTTLTTKTIVPKYTIYGVGTYSTTDRDLYIGLDIETAKGGFSVSRSINSNNYLIQYRRAIRWNTRKDRALVRDLITKGLI